LDAKASIQEPEDLLDLKHWDLYRNFTLGDDLEIQLEDWSSFAEVRPISGAAVKGRQEIILMEIPSVLQPVSIDTDRPSVFSLGVSGAGITLGAPVLVQSSGSDEADALALEWLSDSTTITNLPSGLLEVRVFL